MKKPDRKLLIQIVSYFFWGGCTTVINIAVFFFLRQLAAVPLIPANLLAWTVAVLFAFFTNRRYVFAQNPGEETGAGFGGLVGELIRFFAARLFSGGLDMVLMYMAVSWAESGEFAAKIAVNAIVIVINYVTSALFVFKKSEEIK